MRKLKGRVFFNHLEKNRIMFTQVLAKLKVEISVHERKLNIFVT